MAWIVVERPDGARESVNAGLVQRVRSFEGVTRLVFRAMPGGYDEIPVKGAPDDALARLRAGADWPAEEPAPRETGRPAARAARPNQRQKPS